MVYSIVLIYMRVATFGGGCFWCTEAIFKRLKGVISVMSGYAGGTMENPSYEDVSSGATGHAEAVQIEFDPKEVSYETLLKIFFAFHDPTTKDRQGGDVGAQYRSVIFYHNGDQKNQAESFIRELEKKRVYKSPIVTEVAPIGNFYTAEEYHQNFFAKNPSYPYCQLVIDPKIQKLLDEHKELLKN